MDNIPTYIFQSSLTFGLLTLFYYFLLSKDLRHKSNRVFLLFIPVVSALLPFVRVNIPIEQIVQPYATELTNTKSPIGETSIQYASGRDLMHPIWMVYFLGVVITSLRFIAGLAILLHLKAKGSIRKIVGATIVTSDGYTAPFSFMNTIYLPSRGRNNGACDHILQHELVHIRQKHSWDILYSHFCCVLHWFNPMVWWYQQLVKENHEYLADRGVIEKGHDPINYQYQLIRSISGRKISKLAAYSHFSNSQLLKKRIIMLNQGKLLPRRALRYLVALPFIGLALVVSGQIKTVEVQHNASISQAYGGSIPNAVLANKTIYVDDAIVSNSDFQDQFTNRNNEWLVECAIIYANKSRNLFVYTSEEACNKIMPPPPPAAVAPAPPSAPSANLPPQPESITPPEPPTAPIAPPAPPVPTHWNSLDNWGNLQARKDYLREMKRQGATFWLNDEAVEPEILESLSVDDINNTDVSARMNNRKQTITIKVYTKQ